MAKKQNPMRFKFVPWPVDWYDHPNVQRVMNEREEDGITIIHLNDRLVLHVLNNGGYAPYSHLLCKQLEYMTRQTCSDICKWVQVLFDYGFYNPHCLSQGVLSSHDIQFALCDQCMHMRRSSVRIPFSLLLLPMHERVKLYIGLDDKDPTMVRQYRDVVYKKMWPDEESQLAMQKEIDDHCPHLGL